MRKKLLGLLFALLVFLAFFVPRAHAASWVSIGTWPAGSGYSHSIWALTTGTDGKIWAAGGGGDTAYWNGSSWVSTGKWPYSATIKSLATGTDGKIWAAGPDLNYIDTAYWDGSKWVSAGSIARSGDGKIVVGKDGKIWISTSYGLAYRSGSSWVSVSDWPYSDTIRDITVDANGNIWAAGNNGYTAYWNGSSWVGIGQWPTVIGNSFIGTLVTDTEGRVWAAGKYGYIYYWNGSSWIMAPYSALNDSYASTIGTDGKVWFLSELGKAGYYYDPSKSMVDSGRGPDSNYTYYYAITTGKDGKIYVASTGNNGGILYYYSSDNTLNLTPSPNGPTGQLVLKPSMWGSTGLIVQMQYSADGVNYTNAGIPYGGTVAVVPTGNTTHVRSELKFQVSKGIFNTLYSNVVQVPTISAPSVAIETGRVTWDSARGRSWIKLNFPTTNATGYKIHIFDGNTYRAKDLGNVTSWDSRTAKIFPYPSDLPENNIISTDPFRWDGSGLDFEDTAKRLYRSTVGTYYDNCDNYWFRVTAYNQWMETNFDALSAIKTPTLPNATDAQQPTGTASAVSSEGLKKTFNTSIKVTVNVQDSQSGIRRIELSNDGVSYTQVYAFALNPDNGTGVSSYSNTFDWMVPLGAGTKVVYVRVTDAVGNQNVITDTITLAEDMLPPSITLTINGGADSTTSATVTLTITAQDNASTASQMQMRFSNDGNLWSVWEAFQQAKSWDITNAGYGGTSSAGIKKVYVQVCDLAQNVALATDDIGYNPTPPSGSVTIVGGASGTWNGKSALFTNSDSPTLNLNYSGATQVRFDPGAGVWGDWESYASQKTVYLVKSQGACRLRVQVKDAYGVAGTPQEFIVVVDPTPPTIQALRGLAGATATRTSSVALEITASDNLPGMLQYSYQVNGGSWSAYANLTGGTITVSGLSSVVNVINVSVKDLAGNASQKSITIFKI